ncbi:MAG: hypothetical protein HKN16_06030 [Saprospiraceae bacterium]|nr:hypothetical protein [Saprospiraceae bacterium]
MKAFMNVMVFLMISMPLFSDSIVDPSVSVKRTSEKAFSLQVSNAVNEEVQVSIIDGYGEIVYSHRFVDEKDISRTYNLTKLPEGDYSLNVEKPQSLWIQPLAIEAGMLQIQEQALKTVFKPTIRAHEDLVDFDLLCPVNSEVKIRIFDESEEKPLYTETLETEGSLQKRFNLSQLEDGHYLMDVQINDGDQTFAFRKTIELEK